MKTFLSGILAFVLGLSMTACVAGPVEQTGPVYVRTVWAHGNGITNVTLEYPDHAIRLVEFCSPVPLWVGLHANISTQWNDDCYNITMVERLPD